MARSRNIKPSIMSNDELAALLPLTRLLFIYLWMLADREGRLEDKPARIAAQGIPYDRNADAEAMLSSLVDAGFITRYEAKGIKCIQIVNFEKHQNPHQKEAASSLPAPDESGASPVQAPEKPGASPVLSPDKQQPSPKRSRLIPDPRSLIPDPRYLIPDPLINWDRGRETVPAKAVTPRPSKKCPASFEVTEDMAAWASDQCPAVDAAKATLKFRDHTFKNPISDWVAAWRNWVRRDADWATPAKTAQNALSFAERDEMVRRARWEEMTGRRWPTAPANDIDAIDAIDVDSKTLGIER